MKFGVAAEATRDPTINQGNRRAIPLPTAEPQRGNQKNIIQHPMISFDDTSFATRRTMRDRYLAPILLTPFAEDMARRVSRLSIGPLLEICADTGVLTQAIAAAQSAGMTIIATDPEQDAIDHACQKPGVVRVNWQLADPCALPYPDGTFGIVACHFAITTIPTRLRAYKEARRVLKQGGRFIFSVPARLRGNPVAECLQNALINLFPEDPPRFIGRVLHGCADHEAVDDELTEAGYTDAVYSTVDLPFIAACARDVARGYVLGTPLLQEVEQLAPGETERVLTAMQHALEATFGTGRIVSTMRGYVVSAAG